MVGNSSTVYKYWILNPAVTPHFPINVSTKTITSVTFPVNKIIIQLSYWLSLNACNLNMCRILSSCGKKWAPINMYLRPDQPRPKCMYLFVFSRNFFFSTCIRYGTSLLPTVFPHDQSRSSLSKNRHSKPSAAFPSWTKWKGSLEMKEECIFTQWLSYFDGENYRTDGGSTCKQWRITCISVR